MKTKNIGLGGEFTTLKYQEKTIGCGKLTIRTKILGAHTMPVTGAAVMHIAGKHEA